MIANKVLELHPRIRCPQQTYTIDFVFDKDFKDLTLIEINDPPPIAGTSLFLWDCPEDQKIIFEGPLTLRILSEPVPWVLQTDIHPPLKGLIDELRGRNKGYCTLQ
eukprot:TRINITY_DN2145_c0_g1_i1.p2 TRINITY_DN2145_c0_g1~~TRINITY_DN2145_c0_g1_i1.p2  ORF type:complete len:106 (-),score=21.21 TRINITY_DN2145_c0_g1_i1:213-530(-)